MKEKRVGVTDENIPIREIHTGIQERIILLLKIYLFNYFLIYEQYKMRTFPKVVIL